MQGKSGTIAATFSILTALLMALGMWILSSIQDGQIRLEDKLSSHIALVAKLDTRVSVLEAMRR